MPGLNLELGVPEVSPVSAQKFTAKPSNTPQRSRVAVIVAHGMGQQVPYETIDGVAQATQRGAEEAGATIGSSVIRSVRLGTQNDNDIETQLVRVECEVDDKQGSIYDVHIYEAYWAPLTEGKVTAADVVKFLFSSGWNGIWNTTARTYRRWMFGRERQFALATEGVVLAFIGIMLFLLALVFINAVLAASAASHAIGNDHPFPNGSLLVRLTWDFVIVDLAVVLAGMGLVVGSVKLRLTGIIGSFFLALGAMGIVTSAIFMLAHLANWGWAGHVVPGGRWSDFVTYWPLTVLLLWAIELGIAHTIREYLIQYVGDVAAYVAAHSASKFWEIRQQIWKAAMKVARAVYRARTAGRSDDFLYDKIVILGHSLGSVIGYDVLNGLLLEEQVADQDFRIVERTRMFLTFGSPLDKTAFLFRTLKDMRSEVREVAAAAVQPMIAHYENRPREWVNLWSRFDIISGHLDYYDPPNTENAKHKAHYAEAICDPRAVCNYADPDAHTPLAAHVQYWEGRLLAQHLYRAIVS
jgi:hypothetical protein